MNKRILALVLALLMITVAGLPAMAETDGVNYLNIAPGDCWTVTNVGDTDIPLSLSRMDYVICDAEGNVTARDVYAVYPNESPTLPAGGKLIIHDCGYASSSRLELNGEVTAEKNEPSALLHADIWFGETYAFTNITDHSANVLLRTESNEAWAYYIFNADGTVNKKDFFYNGGGSIRREVLSVPAGGRAAVTTDGWYRFRHSSGSFASAVAPHVYCMARSEYFTMEANAEPAWVFGVLGLNETAAFKNVSGRTQEVYCEGSAAVYYAGEAHKLKAVNAGGTLEVPAGYTVAMGGASLDGSRYALLNEAFEPAELPAPVIWTTAATLKVTFTNVSGKAAPFFGVTTSMLEKNPDKYAALGAGVISDTECEGVKGIMLPTGGKVIITGVNGSFRALSGQFEISAEPIKQAGVEAVVVYEGESVALANDSDEAREVILCGTFSAKGDYYDILEKSYTGLGSSSKMNIKAGDTTKFTAVSGVCSLQFAAGDFTVTEGVEPVYKYKVLRAGETFVTPDVIVGDDRVHRTGHPYRVQELKVEKNEEGYDDVTLHALESCGTTIFRFRTAGGWSEINAPLTETVSLSKRESVKFTWKDEAVENGVTLSGITLKGAVAYVETEWDDYSSGYISNMQPRAFTLKYMESDTLQMTFTALEDGCVLRYYPCVVNAQTVESPIAVETLPKGESRIYRPTVSSGFDFFTYGLNAESEVYNFYRGSFGDVRRGFVTPHTENSYEYGMAPIRITATDSDLTLIYLKEHVEKCAVMPICGKLISGGEVVSRDDVGQVDIDTVEVSVYTEQAGPFTLILASYDENGRLIDAVSRPAVPSAAEGGQIITVSFPFTCSTDTAKVRLFALDGQNKPVTKALTIYDGENNE
ncbi:MAG: hypothetical protein IKD89_05885 [Clostridia bacterium]|nr:hypothetical protein [Clostridia bacterium]